MDPDVLDRRLYWRSRRGMLELELQLLPFFMGHYPDLGPEQKVTYAALLEHEDWEIFDWLQGRAQPEDHAMEALVEVIRDADGR